MKKRALILTVPVFLSFSAAIGQAQTVEKNASQQKRVSNPVLLPPPIVLPAIPPPGQSNPPSPKTTPSSGPDVSPVPAVPLTMPLPKPVNPLSMHDFQSRLTEAERLMKSKPSLTSYSLPGLSTVRMALLEPDTNAIHLVSLSKDVFLNKGAQIGLATSLGKSVRFNIIRANGVNTAVAAFDETGKSYIPLVVEYPIERFGAVREIAYYTSAHPALLSPAVVKDGQSYIQSMIDLAAKRLKMGGVSIAPNILDAAERLCVVEHTDHDRFRRENRLDLFQEIYSLYALNQLDTYRYSVSVAGAGGMVQMIPATYQMLRRLHPMAGLNPDFVAGMRNHGNALEAMLLYMQDTWNDLTANPEVMDALSNKIAAPAELMAAGYNSNPAKLPQYLRRGGSSWRSLIPRETQMYLQIYQSIDSLMPIKTRS